MPEIWFDAMIYLSVFAFSALCVYLADKCRGLLKLLVLLIGLGAPALLAGFRDEKVGVDVLAYAKWMCLTAQRLDFLSFLNAESGVASIGWNVFTWIVTRLTGGLPGYLFCIECACVIPVYVGLSRCSHGTGTALAFLSWLLLFYAFSLNGMRQSVAMSIVFYSVIYIFERKPWHYLFGVFFACLFHQTAVIAFALYPLAAFFVYGQVFKNLFGKWRYFFGCIGLIGFFGLCLVFGPSLVRGASVLKESYSYQLVRLGETDFSIAGFYTLVCLLLVLWVSRKDFALYKDQNSDAGIIYGAVDLKTAYSFIAIASIVGCVCWQLNMVSPTLGRLGYYGVALIPYMALFLYENDKRSKGHLFLLVFFLAVYFIVMILVLGKEGAYPYTSTILGILGA